MIRMTNVLNSYVASSTDGSLRDDDIKYTAEMMCWARAVQCQSVADDHQAQLIGVVVVVLIEPDVKITDDVFRGLEAFYIALGHVNLIRNYYYYFRLLEYVTRLRMAANLLKNFCVTVIDHGR